MTDHTPNLTDQDVLDRARTCLQKHLPLHADGSACTTQDLLQVLLGVAVNRSTIEAICADLLHTPDPETIRRYLNAHLLNYRLNHRHFARLFQDNLSLHL